MWSASSITVISMASRRTWRWPMRSSRRPGQATMMSTPRRSASHLTVLAHAAEDRGGGQAVGLGERLEHRVDLGRELAGRGEHEAERHAAAAAAAGELGAEARDHRDGERERLARARLAAAEHVATGERVGKGVDLDRESSGLAVGREGGDEGLGHAERAESDISH